MSVPLVAAIPDVAARASDGDDQQARLAYLEDLDAIRSLDQEYVRLFVAGDRDALEALFADPDRAWIDPEVRDLAPDGFGERDAVDIAPDRQTARAVRHCIVHLETPIGPSCPLVDMARQQGGGVMRRSERARFEISYVRREGSWSIERVTRAMDG